MKNPFYILHLTDFHFTNSYKYLYGDSDISREEKNNLVKSERNRRKDILEKINIKIKSYLKNQKIDAFDMMAVTGDMSDKNMKGGFRSATKYVRELKNSFVDGDVYTAPGNHDLEAKKVRDILNNKKENWGRQLNERGLPKGLIVDSCFRRLGKAFERYKKFSHDIGAANANNPLYGCKIRSSKHKNIFISWFNTSWLALGKDWEDVNTPKTLKSRDVEMLSVGYDLNKSIYDAWDRFSKKNHSNSFTLSLSHHYNRDLNFFDKHGILKPFDVGKLDHKIAKQLPEGFYSKRTNRVTLPKRNNCFYSHVSKYDLVLNGHTHGALMDEPFLTSNGCFTTQSNFGHHGVTVIKVDVARGFYLVDYLIVDKDEKEPPMVKVFHRPKFLETLRSRYLNQDLIMDLRLNSTKDQFRPRTKTIHPLELSLNYARISRKQLEGKVNFAKRDYEKYPFIKEDFVNEKLSLSKKMKEFNGDID